MNSPSKLNIIEVYDDASDALKAVSRNKIASRTRVAIWNAFFSETPLPLSTSLRHMMISSFQKYLTGGPTDRFCFELSVLFFDLPTQFYELTSIFPIPLSIAMRDAYKVVNGHLQMPNQESITKLITNLIQTLPKEKLPIFMAILRSILWDKSEIDTYIDRMKELLEPACFDSFLEAMPPIPHLRYALRYNRPPPKVNIDYHKLEMPIEFIQAIAEIDGCSEARNLSSNNELESILESEESQDEIENSTDTSGYSNLSSSNDDDVTILPTEPSNSIKTDQTTNSSNEMSSDL